MPIFLQIPGVTGESLDAQHTKWIELTALSFGVRNPVVAGAPRKPTFDTVIASKAVDSTSFVLYGMVLNSKAIDSSVIEVTGSKAPSGASSILHRVVLKQGAIVSIASQLQTTGTPDTETIEFSCSQMQWNTSTVQANGQAGQSVQTGWDVTENAAV